jgi:hypothetical protein
MPLKYKYIGSEQHLTFDSIRKLVFHQLSALDRRKAWKHVENCYRCGSIHESLTRPSNVRKNRSRSSSLSKVFHGTMLILGLIGMSISFIHFGVNTKVSGEDVLELYSWGLMKIKNEELSKVNHQPPDVHPSDHFMESVTNSLLKSIDPIADISGNKHPGSTSNYKKTVISYPDAEQDNQHIRFYEIHGIITVNDEPLQGVTIMVPDSKTAKVSNAQGKYNIQVTGHTASLLFIYRGKQLVKTLDSTPGRLDINLTIEKMTYPKVGSLQTGKEFIADN